MPPNSPLPKPAHLAQRYGDQFQDQSIARAYHTRPPYPPEFFKVLNQLHAPALGGGPRKILELGCGTGDATLGLIGQADHIDAIEPSAAMIAIAKRRPNAGHPSLRWICAPAETAPFAGPYSLALAADSLHWMEWSVVLPRIAAALTSGGNSRGNAVLALASRENCRPMPWDAELRRLISQYSTNQDFRPYDLVSELTRRELFREVGRHTTAPAPFAQSIEDHIESLHSRNGFSRQRISAEAAKEFDQSFRNLLERHCRDGVVRFQTTAKIIWGIPGGS